MCGAASNAAVGVGGPGAKRTVNWAQCAVAITCHLEGGASRSAFFGAGANDLTLFVLEASSTRHSACTPFTELSHLAVNGAVGETALGSCAGIAAVMVALEGHGADVTAVLGVGDDGAHTGDSVGGGVRSVAARGGARAPGLPIADIAVDRARVVLTGVVPFGKRADRAACSGGDNYTRLHANTTAACKGAFAIGCPLANLAVGRAGNSSASLMIGEVGASLAAESSHKANRVALTVAVSSVTGLVAGGEFTPVSNLAIHRATQFAALRGISQVRAYGALEGSSSSNGPRAPLNAVVGEGAASSVTVTPHMPVTNSAVDGAWRDVALLGLRCEREHDVVGALRGSSPGAGHAAPGAAGSASVPRRPFGNHNIVCAGARVASVERGEGRAYSAAGVCFGHDNTGARLAASAADSIADTPRTPTGNNAVDGAVECVATRGVFSNSANRTNVLFAADDSPGSSLLPPCASCRAITEGGPGTHDAVNRARPHAAGPGLGGVVTS